MAIAVIVSLGGLTILTLPDLTPAVGPHRGVVARHPRCVEALLARLRPGLVDLTQRLAGAGGRIEPRFTSDGIHVNDARYAAIADLVPTS